MTPADGSDFAGMAPVVHSPVVHTLGRAQAILLHGGRALLLFEGTEAPLPHTGTLACGVTHLPWIAESWQTAQGEAGRWCGIAVLPAMPAGEAEIEDAASGRLWRLAAPGRIDITPEPLVALVRAHGIDSRAIFGFLSRHLRVEQAGDSDELRAHRSFARSFLVAAAERDGFIEILAAPDGGGLFAQGWSLSLGAGPTTLATVSEDLEIRAVEVAHFDRADILPPARGFCFFKAQWAGTGLETVDVVFFESLGRLLRLDVVRASVVHISGEAATVHVHEMLARLEAPDPTLRAFRRICRPRFQSVDTLSGANLPIAAALDAVLRAPDGGLLAIGWLLDPLRRVERVLVKSSANLYGCLNDAWCPLPRPDLNQGFGADPRFAGLIDPNDILHGFIAHLPAQRAETENTSCYLEVVLDDETCFFRPIDITPFDSAERLPQVLAALAPGAPERARIVREHLAPFLESVRPRSARRARQDANRPIPLGASDRTTCETAAIMPFARSAELQPVLALLAGTPEALALDLTLVTTRAVAADCLERLGDAFAFYGLTGSLVIAPDHETGYGRLDAGLAATRTPRVLGWMPCALPRDSGWLERLSAEADALDVPGLLSPSLVYEDGSIYFGGDRAETPAPQPACRFAGYGDAWLRRGAPERVSMGAAEIALLDRDVLERIGGFSGRLFSDAFAHADLAARLRREGLASWRSGSVAFWMLDDPQDADDSPQARLLHQIDAAMLERRQPAALKGPAA